EVQERRLLAPMLLALGLRRRLPRLYASTPIADARALGFASHVPVAEWLEEMAPDSPSWETRDYSTAVGRVGAPVQLVGGWYDIFLPWLLEDFRALGASRQRQLVIGPWTHTSPGPTGYALRAGIGWLRAHLLGDARLVEEA